MTWLSLAREAAPRKTVLLGRVTWEVNWAASKGFAGYRYATPAEVPHVVGAAVIVLAQELTAVTLPDLADGRSVPDYRNGASANGYSVCRLTRPGQADTQWTFNDNDDPRQAALNAPPSTTWFT